MTFPVVELFCPECSEPMTLINQPSIENCVSYTEYDKQVDYHYQCKANERHTENINYCNMSRDEQVVIMRILIPKLNLDNYNESVSTTTESPRIQAFKKAGLNVISTPKELSKFFKDDEKDKLTIEEIERKAKLVKDKYPDMTEYNLRFMRAGETVVMANPLSDEDAYVFFRNIAEMINPKKLDLPKEEYFNQLGNKTKSFMNNCLDIIINEDSLDSK